MTLVIGVDVGGSSVTAVAASEARAGVGHGPGANLNSGGPEAVHTAVESAVSAALVRHGRDVPATVSAVVGASGAADAGRERILAIVRDVWSRLGLPADDASLELSTDLGIAFAAGTEAADGLLLLAGTGAVAARVSGGVVTDRRDGMGWLLGDVGSGLWLSLEAVRAAAADLDARGARTALTAAVLRALGVPETPAAGDAGAPAAGHDARQSLVRAAYAAPIAALAPLAPLVSRAADDGDAVAGAIVTRAVAALVRDVTSLVPSPEERSADGAHVVLAGSVLTRRGPVARGVRAELTRRMPGAAIREAEAPVLGALRLADRRTGARLTPAARDRAAALVRVDRP